MERKPDVVWMEFGSHLYHLNTKQSDIDYKGIYMPEFRELMLHTYPKSIKSSTGGEHVQNKPGDIDRELISLPRFIDLAVKGETMAIDMLHCSNPISSSDIWESLVAVRTRFYSQNLKAFVGYVKHQAAKYGVKGSRLADMRRAIDYLNKTAQNPLLPIGHEDIWHGLPKGEFLKEVRTEGANGKLQRFYEVNGKKYQDTVGNGFVRDRLLDVYTQAGARARLAEQNEGVDWKALSHALRAAYQVRDIYRHGDFEYPLGETVFLKNVKNGMVDYKSVVAPELERVVDEVDVLAKASDLPKKVDVGYWQDWLMDAYDYTFGLNSDAIHRT